MSPIGLRVTFAQHSSRAAPQTKGKAERFIETLLNERAYALHYRSNAERLDVLPAFLDLHDHDHPDTEPAVAQPSTLSTMPVEITAGWRR